MLVITRKSGQSLFIGDDVEVKILSVYKDQVKIGIQAPRSVLVYRQEVYESIIRQNQLASQSGLPTADLVSPLKRQNQEGPSRPQDSTKDSC